MSIANSRIKNIIISGYPKSGTMWTTRLVAQVLDCPVKGYWGINDATSVIEGGHRISQWACYLSHHSYDELNKIEFSAIHKIIYLIRDPRDIVVSGAFHFNFYHAPISKIKSRVKNPSQLLRFIKYISRSIYGRKNRINRMISMLNNGDPFINQCQHPWDKHIHSYLNQGVFFIRYEDLLADGLNTIKRLLTYIGVSKTDNEILDAIHKQSFEVRKEEFINTKDNVRSKHLRKGNTGDWKNHLSDNDFHEIVNSFGGLMKKLNYV